MRKDAQDNVREVIREALRKKGHTKRWLSLQLRKAPGYMHDFLEDGVPSKLKYETCVQISRILDVPLTRLGVELPPDIPASPDAASMGFGPDVQFLPKAVEAHIAQREHEIRCKVLSEVLNQHPVFPLLPGDLIVVDKTEEVLAQITTGSIVLAYLHDKEEDKATPILREFVEPSVLIANTTSRKVRSILDTRDTALPFDILIVGKLTFAGRGNGQSL
jgi:hypothetical protein